MELKTIILYANGLSPLVGAHTKLTDRNDNIALLSGHGCLALRRQYERALFGLYSK